MSRLLRRILLALVLVMIAAAVAWAFIPKPVPVDVAEIDFGPLRVTVDEDGKTRIREKYVVSAPLAGRLQRIQLDPGDPVKAEETVIALIAPTDPSLLDVRALTEAEARVNAAEAGVNRADALLARAQETLDYTRRERDRYEAAFARDAARQQELDNRVFAHQVAEQDLRSAQFGRDVAKFELEQAKAALLRTQPDSGNDDNPDLTPAHFAIHSPINGEVLRVMQESAAVVTPGMPLIELGDPRDLEVVVDVLSTDGAKIEPGATVIFDGWGGEHELFGKVRHVEPSGFTKISALGVEEERVNVIIDFTSPPQERSTLGDHFRVDAHIVLWQQDRVLKVPMSALFRSGEEWSVFTIDGGRAERRTIQIGRRNGFEAEVIDGLRPGERVITHPSDAVKDNGRVAPRS
jgi:HlyD family secretion protein